MNKQKVVSIVCLFFMLMLVSSCAGPQVMSLKSHPVTDVYDGWKLGMQAYSFKKFTFCEAVDKTAALGLGWIETGPFNQSFSKDDPDLKVGHTMSAAGREKVKQKLKDAGVKLIAYGVVIFDEDETKPACFRLGHRHNAAILVTQNAVFLRLRDQFAVLLFWCCVP